MAHAMILIGYVSYFLDGCFGGHNNIIWYISVHRLGQPIVPDIHLSTLTSLVIYINSKIYLILHISPVLLFATINDNDV